MEPLSYKMDLPIVRDRVWQAWTTEQGLTSWLCSEAKVEPVIGGSYQLFWNSSSTKPKSKPVVECRVLSILKPRLLQFTWRSSEETGEKDMNAPGGAATEITVEFFPTLDGTRLVITHSGWQDGPGWAEARTRSDHLWSNALERLRFVLLQQGSF